MKFALFLIILIPYQLQANFCPVNKRVIRLNQNLPLIDFISPTGSVNIANGILSHTQSPQDCTSGLQTFAGLECRLCRINRDSVLQVGTHNFKIDIQTYRQNLISFKANDCNLLSNVFGDFDKVSTSISPLCLRENELKIRETLASIDRSRDDLNTPISRLLRMCGPIGFSHNISSNNFIRLEKFVEKARSCSPQPMSNSLSQLLSSSVACLSSRAAIKFSQCSTLARNLEYLNFNVGAASQASYECSVLNLDVLNELKVSALSSNQMSLPCSNLHPTQTNISEQNANVLE